MAFNDYELRFALSGDRPLEPGVTYILEFRKLMPFIHE